VIVGQLRSTVVVPEFGISEERREALSIIKPHGEIDVATAPGLRDYLDKVTGGDGGPIVVDLTAVTFIDSTGLGVLIGAQKHCDETERELRIVVTDPRIRKVFEITGLTDHFAMHDSLEPALRL
jgi:anti-sigma B factor antagonist